MTVLRLLVSVAMALSLASCTIPTTDDPIELTGTIPPLETTTTTTTQLQTTTKQVSMYLLQKSSGSARLVEVQRSVDVAAGMQEILSNLFTVRPDAEGTERATERGLTTDIPENATLVSAELAQGTSHLVVNVRGLFGLEGVQGSILRNALAQIVWTATESEHVSDVSFENDGVPVQALIDDGEIAEGPVDRNDYAAVN